MHTKQRGPCLAQATNGQSLNFDPTIEDFYEERRKRKPTIKQHNLLKRNVSYFSYLEKSENVSCTEELQETNKKRTFSSSKHDLIKKYLPQSAKSPLRQSRQNESNGQVTMGSIHKNNFKKSYCIQSSNQSFDDDQSNVPRFGYSSVHRKQSTPLADKTQIEQYMKKYETFSSKGLLELVQEPHQNIQKIMKTPSFDPLVKNQSYHTSTQNLLSKNTPYTGQEKFAQQEIGKISQLQSKLIQMEGKMRVQQRFLDSLQKMRQTIQKTNEECSLKQLWQWVKALPKKKSPSQKLAY